jgi:hypothetical protein
LKDFIPTEEEFETLLSALGSYEKEKMTMLVVEQCLKQCEGLNNEEAFLKAFSKNTDKQIEELVKPKTKEIRDTVILLFAKIIKFRDYVRAQRLSGAIEDLTQ